MRDEKQTLMATIWIMIKTNPEWLGEAVQTAISAAETGKDQQMARMATMNNKALMVVLAMREKRFKRFLPEAIESALQEIYPPDQYPQMWKGEAEKDA